MVITIVTSINVNSYWPKTPTDIITELFRCDYLIATNKPDTKDQNCKKKKNETPSSYETIFNVIFEGYERNKVDKMKY